MVKVVCFYVYIAGVSFIFPTIVLEPQAKRRKRKLSAPQKVEQTYDKTESSEELVPAPSNNNNVHFLSNLIATVQTIQAQQQHQLEQECAIFGRQVQIDLSRLNAVNRAKARLAITCVLSEFLHEEQRQG